MKILILILSLGLCGCAGLRDLPKTIWGSSTRVLEQERSNALTKTYDKGYWETVRATIKILDDKGYVIFKRDEVRGVLIVMGIPGAVDTTEVGVFFVELGENQTRIELSSLSTNAKRLLSRPLFHALDIVFGLVPADQGPVVQKKQFIDISGLGEGAFKQLIAEGILEQISPTEALLKKDPEEVRGILTKEFPEHFEQILLILKQAKEQANTENPKPTTNQ